MSQSDGKSQILRKISELQNGLIELRALLADADLVQAAADDNRCPDCQLTFRGPNTLAEHRYHQHDGPEPPHWLAAEALASPAPVVAEHVHAPAKKGAE